MSGPQRIDTASIFRGSFTPVRTSIVYRLGLLLVAGVMVLLPLVYILLIAAIAYAVYWHAVTDVVIFQHVRGSGGAKAALLAYVAPIVGGVVCVLFMLKPLFAPRREKHEPYVLSPADEPVLFGYVEALCRLIGAPVPRQISVDCDVNASAGLRRGFRSMLGSDLELVIGLPLAAGLTLRELSGVLAHEFGHFTQGTAMRANYVVRRINGWFARVVYERDAWDAQLEDWQAEGGGWVSLVVLLIRGLVYLTRLVLKVLMYLGHAVSCFLTRQMEYDADRHQARLAGSDQFVPTFKRILELGAAWHAALAQAQSSWERRQLPDNLPALTATVDNEASAEAKAKLYEMTCARRTGLFDTHPAMRDRARSVERAAEPGIMRTDLPAECLFRNFADVCRRASYLHYRAILGEGIMNATFVPTKSVVHERAQERQVGEAFERYFGNLRIEAPVIPGAAPGRPVDPAAALAELRSVRAALVAQAQAAETAAAQLTKLDEPVGALETAEFLLARGAKFMPGTIGLQSASPEAVAQRRAELDGSARRPRAALRDRAEMLARRLHLALSLLHASGAVKKISDADSRRARVSALWPALAAAAGALPATEDIQRSLVGITAFANAFGLQKDKKKADADLKAAIDDLRTKLTSMAAGFGAVSDPFDTAAHSLRDYVLPQAIPPADISVVMSAAGEGRGRVLSVYYRCLAELAAHAEAVEGVLGMTPLKPASAEAVPTPASQDA